MRKNTIETALAEYNVLVGDAARAFQAGIVMTSSVLSVPNATI